MVLAQVPLNKNVTVESVQRDGWLGRRLMELGLVRGATVCVIRRAPLGDPLHLRVGDYDLSLRAADAAAIETTAA